MKTSDPVQLTLIIPDLIPPRDSAVADLPNLPGLAALLAACRDFTPCDDGLEGLLCARFGIVKQNDWPAAPVLAADAGIDTRDDYWFCAEPVHLQAQGDTLVFDPAAMRYSADELAALFATLNRHFAADDMQFIVAPGPASAAAFGYLRCPGVVAASALSAAALQGRSIFQFMPQGEDGKAVRRWLNEIQMLLHDDPVNAAREEHGEPPINSVWLWGGGKLPVLGAAPLDGAWGTHRLLQALAHAHRVPYAATIPDARAIISGAQAQRALVLFDGGISAAGLASLDAQWLTLCARAFEQGRIEVIDLALGGTFDDGIGWRSARCTRTGSSLRSTLSRLLQRGPRLTVEIDRLRASA